MPSEVKKLIRPGKWKLYELDEWVKKSDTIMVHRDRELVFEAPKIKEIGEENE